MLSGIEKVSRASLKSFHCLRNILLEKETNESTNKQPDEDDPIHEYGKDHVTSDYGKDYFSHRLRGGSAMVRVKKELIKEVCCRGRMKVLKGLLLAKDLSSFFAKCSSKGLCEEATSQKKIYEAKKGRFKRADSGSSADDYPSDVQNSIFWYRVAVGTLGGLGVVLTLVIIGMCIFQRGFLNGFKDSYDTSVNNANRARTFNNANRTKTSHNANKVITLRTPNITTDPSSNSNESFHSKSTDKNETKPLFGQPLLNRYSFKNTENLPSYGDSIPLNRSTYQTNAQPNNNVSAAANKTSGKQIEKKTSVISRLANFYHQKGVRAGQKAFGDRQALLQLNNNNELFLNQTTSADEEEDRNTNNNFGSTCNTYNDCNNDDDDCYNDNDNSCNNGTKHNKNTNLCNAQLSNEILNSQLNSHFEFGNLTDGDDDDDDADEGIKDEEEDAEDELEQIFMNHIHKRLCSQ